ncbi:hypothetical protein BDY24DRAFT_8510 [Mrakia frigida]|uniref:uncharacterized protein n=1 Tax=Mrakia frigida TaxID=29902 RepID=UPI003FCC08F9
MVPPPLDTGGDNPDRRSVADITELISGMFPQEGVLLSKDLLPLISKLEVEQNIQIFGAEQTSLVEGIVAEHPDLELTLDGLLDLLVQIIPPTIAASPFQQSTPTDPTTPSLDSPAGTRPRHKRSSSARIRSSSDTSSSDSDTSPPPSNDPTLTFPTSAHTPLSAASSSESLAGSQAHQPIRRKVLSNASSDGGGLPGSAADQALARVKGTPDVGGGEKVVKPPSSWERFQRPGAPSRSGRRRKSASAAASSAGRGGGTSDAGSDHEGRENVFNPPQTPTQGPHRPATGKGGFIRSRQTSQPNVIPTPAGTPTQPSSHSHHHHSNSIGSNLPASRSIPESLPLGTTSPPPGSPNLDERSFFSLSGMMRSPLDSPLEESGMEGALERQQRESMGNGAMHFPGMGGHAGREMSLGEDGREGDGEVEAGEMRLPRDSTASAHSLSSFHDRVTALDKVNTDLTRKLKAAQLELENSASEHERIALDYQNRLDDLRGEVVGKRREEKELRGKERGYLIQIQTFESDIGKLHRSLESQKATYSTLLKNYTEQCGVSEELRNAIRLKDIELREAQENIDVMKSDVEKWTREQEYLEEANRMLIIDLATARQAEIFLEEQKMENLMLKETINRLRGDLDELRTMSTAGGSGNNTMRRPNSMAGGRTDSSSGTMSRSLEKELLRQLREGEGGGASGSTSGADEDAGEGEEGEEAEERDDGDGESFIETFITTSRRRRRVQGTRSDNPITVEVKESKEIIEYVDAGVQATPPEVVPVPTTEISIQTDESTMGRLPAYTPRLEDELAATHKASSSSTQDDDASSSLLLSPSSATTSSREDTSSPTLRRRKRESVVQNIYNTCVVRLSYSRRVDLTFRLLVFSSSRLSFHYTPSGSGDDGYRRPLSHTALKLAPWVVVSLLLGYYFGSHYASNSPLDTFSGDLAQWSRYNTLARTQGAGVGFAPGDWDSSALVGMLGLVGGVADRVRRVPT